MSASAVTGSPGAFSMGTNSPVGEKPLNCFSRESFVNNSEEFLVSRETIERLPKFLEHEVHKKVYELSGSPETVDLEWGRRHLMENDRILRKAYYEVIVKPLEKSLPKTEAEANALFHAVWEYHNRPMVDHEYGRHHFFTDFNVLQDVLSLYVAAVEDEEPKPLAIYTIEFSDGERVLVDKSILRNAKYLQTKASFRESCPGEAKADEERVIHLDSDPEKDGFQKNHVEGYFAFLRGNELGFEEAEHLSLISSYLIPLFLVTCYFHDLDTFKRLLEQTKDEIAPTIENLKGFQELAETDFGATFYSHLIAGYIRANPTPEAIAALNDLDPSIKKLSLELDLRRLPLMDEALEKLAEVFPNVTSLDISENKVVTKIPASWRSLKMFKAAGAKRLREISGLNGITTLEEIDVGRTAIEEAPAGCSGLKRFKAYGARRLREISGLNGITTLEEVDVRKTAIEEAPRGCSGLKRFKAAGVKRLREISGLNGITTLEEVDVSMTAIEEAPRGCSGLKRFKAYGASSLRNISELGGITTLEEIYVGETAIEEAPTGCSGLKIFNAYFARNLREISGLGGITTLEEIYVRRTAIEEAPRGCSGLKRFHAYGARNLREISGLDNLPNLEVLEVSCTKVRRIPEGCPRLRFAHVNSLK